MSKFELTMLAVEALVEDAQFTDGEYDRLLNLLGTLTEEYEDLEENLEEAEEKTIEDFTDDSLPGIEPIPYKTENLLDGELMEAFGKLLEHEGPHAMLKRLELAVKHHELFNQMK